MCVTVCHTCASAWGGQKRALEPQGLEVSVVVSWAAWYGCWELNPNPPHEQSVLLTSEPSLQPREIFLFKPPHPLCSPGWPQIWAPPALASTALKWQVCQLETWCVHIWVPFRGQPRCQSSGIATWFVPRFFEIYLFLFYVYGYFAACFSGRYMCTWCPWRPKEGIESPGTEVMDSC